MFKGFSVDIFLYNKTIVKSSDSLFKLIKSLTIAEKGYFKKYTAKHVIGEKNDYTILFEAIDALEEYNEELLLKKLSAESFVHRISAVKNYLNKLVLGKYACIP